MKKALIIAVLLTVLTGLVSAKFITVDPGNGQETVDTDQINSAQSKGSASGSSKDFVSLYGDTLKGALDMAGFGLTGLPSPDDPEDAATKSYVDDTLSEVYVSASNTSSGSQPSTLSTVLDKGNVADQVIRFSNGLRLGDSDTSAVENSIALGNGAEAKQNNSVAVGEGSEAVQENTMTLGSNENPLSLSVSGDTVLQGDLRVEGQIKGINVSDNSTYSSDQNVSEQSSRVYWSETVDIEGNETQVNITHLNLNSTDYQVSVTSIGSITSTGVFNKTREELIIRSEKPTEADLILTQR